MSLLEKAAAKPQRIGRVSNTSSTISELGKAKTVIDDILAGTGDTKVAGDSRRIVQKVKKDVC